MKVNRELSSHLQQQLSPAAGCRIRKVCHCAISALRELEGAIYVEGWVVLQDRFGVVEHAWLEYEGRIIDLIYGQREVAYFPGLRFDNREVGEAVANRDRLPIAHHKRAKGANNPANSRYPSYWLAWEEAFHYAEAQKRGSLWRAMNPDYLKRQKRG